MNLRAELNRLRSELAARKLQYPKGFWSWTPCPVGSNLGYYEHKGEYSMTVPVGGKGIKIQYATVTSASDRGKDYVEGEPVYPSADDWRHFANHAPMQLFEEYGMTRKELAEALPILWRAKIDKDEPSESILTELLPDFALATKAERQAAITALDTQRGIRPKRSLLKKKVVVVTEPDELLGKTLPSALEMVVAVQEKKAKKAKPEKDPLNESIAERGRRLGKSRVESAFSSNRGWNSWP